MDTEADDHFKSEDIFTICFWISLIGLRLSVCTWIHVIYNKPANIHMCGLCTVVSLF